MTFLEKLTVELNKIPGVQIEKGLTEDETLNKLSEYKAPEGVKLESNKLDEINSSLKALEGFDPSKVVTQESLSEAIKNGFNENITGSITEAVAKVFEVKEDGSLSNEAIQKAINTAVSSSAKAINKTVTDFKTEMTSELAKIKTSSSQTVAVVDDVPKLDSDGNPIDDNDKDTMTIDSKELFGKVEVVSGLGAF